MKPTQGPYFRQVRNPECVSREIFANALSLAANRDLLGPGDATLAARRAALKAELADAVRAVDAIDELDQTRHVAARTMAA